MFTVVGLVSCAAFVPALFVRFDETKIEPVDRPSVWRELASGLRHAASRRELWFVGALEFAIYGSIYSLKAFLPIFALDAGTKLPICAIRAINAFWRRKVDLPAMFGPVMTRTISPFSKMTSFGI